MSAQRDWNVNFLTIPRKARTPTDGILQLTHTNGMFSFYLVLTMIQGLWIIGLDHCVWVYLVPIMENILWFIKVIVFLMQNIQFITLKKANGLY